MEHFTLYGNGATSPHGESIGRPVTEDQKRNALLLAQAALTDDSFLVIMRPTHVYRKFYVVNVLLLPETSFHFNLSVCRKHWPYM